MIFLIRKNTVKSKIIMLMLLFVIYPKLHAQSLNLYTYTLLLDYREYQNGSVIDRDSSHMGQILGVGVKYRKRINEYLYFFATIEGSAGSSSYNGSTWNGEPLENTQNGFYLFNTNAAVGNRYLFLMFGYREWNRGKSNYAGDYDEVYYWPYWGVKYEYPLFGENFAFIPQVSYLAAINPQMKANLGNKPVLDLGYTDSRIFELPLFLYFNTLSIELFYRYEVWHINPSSPVTLILDSKSYTIYEPESYTRNQYVGAGVVWKF